MSYKRSTEMRTCLDCPADISHRGNRAHRCEPCAEVETKRKKAALAHQRWIDRPIVESIPRNCEDCGTQILSRAENAFYCTICANERRSKRRPNNKPYVPKLYPRLADIEWLSQEIVNRTAADIAREVGCSEVTVHQAIMRQDIPHPGRLDRMGRRRNWRDFIGQRFGLMVVTGPADPKRSGHVSVTLDCDCGGTKTMGLTSLINQREGWDHCGCLTHQRVSATRRGVRRVDQTSTGYRAITTDQGKISEHRWVMQQEIGRELLSVEEVHHLNAIRDDNRIGNLELWTKSQPAGARAIDKLKYAREIIGLYAPLFEEGDQDVCALLSIFQ